MTVIAASIDSRSAAGGLDRRTITITKASGVTTPSRIKTAFVEDVRDEAQVDQQKQIVKGEDYPSRRRSDGDSAPDLVSASNTLSSLPGA